MPVYRVYGTIRTYIEVEATSPADALAQEAKGEGAMGDHEDFKPTGEVEAVEEAS